MLNQFLVFVNIVEVDNAFVHNLRYVYHICYLSQLSLTFFNIDLMVNIWIFFDNEIDSRFSLR